jgi:hypothetical protein
MCAKDINFRRVERGEVLEGIMRKCRGDKSTLLKNLSTGSRLSTARARYPSLVVV